MSNRPREAIAVGLALLLALAGCVGPAVDRPATGSPTPADAESATTPSGTASATATPLPASASGTGAGAETATPTAVAEGRSPWGDEPIVVAVRDTAGTGRAWTPLVEEATAYWEANAERFAGFPVDYAVRPDASNPDLVLEFVDSVSGCEGVDDAAGCAPLIEDRRQIQRPETVYVRTGFSDDSTVRVIQHELGHTLGLRHDDPPREIMATRSVLYTEPRPNATERAFPWDDANFTVYVDVANASDPAGAREQVRHALAYYEDDPPGMPTNLSFTTIDSAADAEIVVRAVETSPCRPDAASCGNTVGPDPDGDGAIETYTRLRISLVDLDTDAVAWHAGYWLAHGLGAEDDGEKPPPFREASYGDRRSEWWT